jgi:autotransporter-associated beta strand protein
MEAFLAGPGGLRVTGGGVVRLTGTNTFSGPVVVSAATLQVNNSGNLGNASTAMQLDGGTLSSLSTFAMSRGVLVDVAGGSFQTNTNHTVTLTGDIQGAGTLIKSGAGTLVLTPSSHTHTGNIAVQAGTMEFAPASGSLTIGNSISGAGAVTKSGAGTVVFSGVNTYTGLTTINDGVLQVGSPGALSPFSRVLLANTANAVLGISGSDATIGGLLGGGGSGGAVVNTGALTLNVVSSSTFNGTVTNFGSLTKTGTGTQTLAGTNNYAGTTTVNQGTLQFNSNLTGAGGAVLVNTGGTLAGNNATLSRRVLANAGSTIDAVGNLTLGDSSRFDGFASHGEIITRANTLTLLDANQANLGEQNTLGQGSSAGTISAANGVALDFGRGISGFGTINTPNALAQRTIINGAVSGNSGSEQITFTGWVKGVGTFNHTTFTGTFDPGLSPTLLTVGSITMTGTNTTILELGGAQRGGQYDAIDASGTVDVDGALVVQLLNGFVPTVGDEFLVVARAGGSGTFDGLGEGAVFQVGQSTFAISYQGLNYQTGQLAAGADFNDIVLSAVPEPFTLALFGAAGLGGLGYWRVRRRWAADGDALRQAEETAEERLG